MTIETLSAQNWTTSRRVLDVFNYWFKLYDSYNPKHPQDSSRRALEQTLYPSGLDNAQLKLSDLNRHTSGQIAEAMIKVAEPRLREIIDEYIRGESGDSVEILNFSDPRAKRIFAAAKRQLFPK